MHGRSRLFLICGLAVARPPPHTHLFCMSVKLSVDGLRANVYRPGLLFFDFSHGSGSVLHSRMGMESDSALSSDNYRRHVAVVVRAWCFIWLGLLPINRLALAGETRTRRDRTSGLVHKILRRQTNWRAMGYLSRRYGYPTLRFECIFAFMFA